MTDFRIKELPMTLVELKRQHRKFFSAIYNPIIPTQGKKEDLENKELVLSGRDGKNKPS
jgi:hypothetical protein